MTLKPKFNSRCPENWRDFLRSDSDDAFKKEHPVAYPLLVILAIIAFSAPAILYYEVLQATAAAESTAHLVVGMAGGAVAGAGLVNIVAAFLGQHLGHKVTMNAIFWGIAIMVLAGYLS